MGFTDYLRIPELAERYRKLKRYFKLKESAYDVTSICQLRCDGCFYFEGDKHLVEDNRSAEAWRALMTRESERGINYVNLAGAEPSLVPEILRACHDVIPLGNIFTNGLQPIDRAIRYRIHISIWGDEQGDPIYRRRAGGQPGPFCLPKQLENYRDDERIIFVYTFNHENIDQLDSVLEMVAGEGHQLTFNVFSSPEENQSPLRLADRLVETRQKMLWAMARYPENVVFSSYNAQVHTQPQSLHQQFGCPYPRAQIAAELPQRGLGQTFRSYRADMTHVPEADCCIPDTDCADCRHYAAGSAIVTSRLEMHVASEQLFRCWLDYVDTYLTIWIPGYERGPSLAG